jgi:hypothetical protein
MTAAFRENLILERVFGATLARSSYPWPPHRRVAIEGAQDEASAFVSKVGAHVITAVSESTLRTIMVAILVALAICDLLLRNRLPSRSPPG